MYSPLDKLREGGVGGLGPVELLAIVLAKDEEDCTLRLPHAKELLEKVGGIRNLSRFADATMREYCSESMTPYRFQAAFELGRRSREARLAQEADMCNPEAVFEAFSHLADEPREQVWVALLDVKNRLIHKTRLHIGTLDSSVVGARDVFKEALRMNAASIVLVHNHPSGDPTPSAEDVELTKRLKAAGNHLEVAVLDHVVIGGDSFASLHRLGLIG